MKLNKVTVLMLLGITILMIIASSCKKPVIKSQEQLAKEHVEQIKSQAGWLINETIFISTAGDTVKQLWGDKMYNTIIVINKDGEVTAVSQH